MLEFSNHPLIGGKLCLQLVSKGWKILSMLKNH